MIHEGLQHWSARQSQICALSDPKKSRRELKPGGVQRRDYAILNRLPGGIYNTNYIRQYAQAIGFDETDLLAYYNEVCGPSAESMASPGSLRSVVLFSGA